MSLCFRGGRTDLGRVFLFTGAFFATFMTGYLLSARGVAERRATVEEPVAPVVKKVDIIEKKEFCVLSKPSRVTDGKLEIISKPRAYYTDAARATEIQGKVALRVTFGADGEIGSIVPVSELPDGLTESAIAAAKGIKFIPAVREGKAVSTTKTVEYTFSIY